VLPWTGKVVAGACAGEIPDCSCDLVQRSRIVRFIRCTHRLRRLRTYDVLCVDCKLCVCVSQTISKRSTAVQNVGLSGSSGFIHRCVDMVDSYHDLEHAKTVRDWFGTYLVGFAGVFVLATSQRKILEHPQIPQIPQIHLGRWVRSEE